MIWEWADCEVGQVDGPDTQSKYQLKYFQPWKIVRAANGPDLLDMTGTVVLKTSWTGIDRRESEANMYRDCNGRFGVMPHVCSYEMTGEYGEVISNILFFPEQDEIEICHWPVFSHTRPTEFDTRIFNFSMLGPCGKQLIDAEGPFGLSRAWACSLVGAFVNMRFTSSTHQTVRQGGYPCTYLGTCTGIPAWETS